MASDEGARWQWTAVRRGAADQGSAAAAVGGCAQRVRWTRARGTAVERQQRGSGSLDNGARHGTSRAVTQGAGALGRGGSGLRKEGNGNESGGVGRNLFIKLHGQLKGLEAADELGMNFSIIAKFMLAPISNL